MPRTGFSFVEWYMCVYSSKYKCLRLLPMYAYSFYLFIHPFLGWSLSYTLISCKDLMMHNFIEQMNDHINGKDKRLAYWNWWISHDSIKIWFVYVLGTAAGLNLPLHFYPSTQLWRSRSGYTNMTAFNSTVPEWRMSLAQAHAKG